jgi:uncharacterized membrane protein YphA (DoxX/SURF4 family)
MSTRLRAASWVLRIIAAGILLQTLFFKFTGGEESVYIFTELGMEPWGRIGTGVAELIAAILLVLPPTVWFGAALTLGLMTGAIGGHLTKLGIDVQGDGGLLFTLAIMTLLSSVALVWIYRRDAAPVMRLLSSFRRAQQNASLSGL